MEDIVAAPPVHVDAADDNTISEYAGFWRRFVAYLLDSLILCTVVGIVAAILVLSFYPSLREFVKTSPPVGDSSTAIGWELRILPIMLVIYAFECVVISGSWLYFALMESSRHQATLGKRAMKLVVTDTDGNPISFGRATGRYFAKCLSGMTLGIGYIMAGFTEKKQTLHDMVANTLVLRD